MASDDDQALVPTGQQMVEFYGDLIPLADVGGVPYVPLKPLCAFLGVTWQGQLERTKRDLVLGAELKGISVTLIPSGRGSGQTLQCLPLKFLPGWLFGISARRVTDLALQAKIVRYQRDCHEVLWNAFRHSILPPEEATLSSTPPNSETYRLAESIAAIEARQERIANKQDVMAGYIRGFVRGVQEGDADLRRRVTTLEVHLLGQGGATSDPPKAE